ncbi:MAG: T9SS type A sorting domain-containing protein [Bacteroidetes bacterium]|nr:T9SS type A sorting domain-containing protein [Bacteroidota bacterium]
MLILFTMIVVTSATGQSDPMIFQRWNTMNINRVRTQFNNTGMLCDGNQQNLPLARPPAFEYPNGSGLNWGTCVGFVVGAPAAQDPGAVGGANSLNLEYLDGTMDEGPAAFWDEEHFAPYPEMVGGTKAPLSTDPATWPTAGPNQGWPATIPGTSLPLVVGPEGWPGLGPNGERLADQETYSVMYAWQGTDLGDDERRWLRVQVEMRGMAWVGELYQDFIVWMYVVRNIGTAPIRGLRAGIHADFSFAPIFQNPNIFDADRHYYDPRLQLAYGTDDDGYEGDPDGGTIPTAQIPWAGVIALRMAGPTKSVKTYDAFHFWMEATTPRGNGASKEWYFRYNLANIGDPHDSDDDGIDDDFDENGIPDETEAGQGYYLGVGADGIQVLGSDSLTLAPGEADTVIVATVFGSSRKALFSNAERVRNLYESGWKTVKPPRAPRLEVVPGDGRTTLFWSTESERDPDFEGYKIYRSQDDGVTWGTETFTDFAGTVRYIPMEQYDLANGVTGYYRTLPEYAWFDLGSDRGLPPVRVIGADTLSVFQPGDTVRVFVDDGVTNGLRYRYYVAAYDSGNAIVGPLENTPSSTPAQGTNTVDIVPRAPLSTESLAAVRVVPNPYVIASGWEKDREKQLQFTHLPSQATIKIFNTAGEIVRVLTHSAASGIAPSIATWDLKNESRQLVAPGLYFYHIDSPIGTAQGKFIVIQ